MIDISEQVYFTVFYYPHIATGMIAFFVGPFQFIPYIREHYPHFHHLFGKTYIISVLLSSVTGFVISFKTPLAWAAAGTAIQSILWLGFTLTAYQRIRKRQIASHQRWMIRSYSLVLAAPIVRICISLMEGFTSISYQSNFDFYYPLFVWMSFIPYIIAEIYIRLFKGVLKYQS